MDERIACVDVDYRETVAVGAALWFCGWTATEAEITATASFHDVAEYHPGEFYRRELPCLLGVLAGHPRPDIVIVDGFVWLEHGRPGLGVHLHSALDGIPVVGVAKTRYAGAANVIPVCRGSNRSPLYVSAVGIPIEDAANAVMSMAGPYRVPSMLREVDRLARTASALISETRS